MEPCSPGYIISSRVVSLQTRAGRDGHVDLFLSHEDLGRLSFSSCISFGGCRVWGRLYISNDMHIVTLMNKDSDLKGMLRS